MSRKPRTVVALRVTRILRTFGTDLDLEFLDFHRGAAARRCLRGGGRRARVVSAAAAAADARGLEESARRAVRVACHEPQTPPPSLALAGVRRGVAAP